MAMRNTGLATLVLLSACSGQETTLTYAGPSTPESGTCDPPAQAQLTMHNAAILFSPTSGTLFLQGSRQADNVYASEKLTGADKRAYTLIFQGRIVGSSINGLYETARCRYAVHLHIQQ